jgi:glutathione peroxidase
MLLVLIMKTLALFAAVLCLQAVSVCAGSLYDLVVKNIDGQDAPLSSYRGKVLLVVNVASKCGFTPQYKALEALQKKYAGKGFTVLGFPCNQFAHQEPGSDSEIKHFCSSTYGVTFPLFDKIEVNGPRRAPLYVLLAGSDSPFSGNIRWNFTKFLISRDGKILQRFEPRTTPGSPQVVRAIEAALAQK